MIFTKQTFLLLTFVGAALCDGNGRLPIMTKNTKHYAGRQPVSGSGSSQNSALQFNSESSGIGVGHVNNRLSTDELIDSLFPKDNVATLESSANSNSLNTIGQSSELAQGSKVTQTTEQTAAVAQVAENDGIVFEDNLSTSVGSGQLHTSIFAEGASHGSAQQAHLNAGGASHNSQQSGSTSPQSGDSFVSESINHHSSANQGSWSDGLSSHKENQHNGNDYINGQKTHHSPHGSWAHLLGSLGPTHGSSGSHGSSGGYGLSSHGSHGSSGSYDSFGSNEWDEDNESEEWRSSASHGSSGSLGSSGNHGSSGTDGSSSSHGSLDTIVSSGSYGSSGFESGIKDEWSQHSSGEHDSHGSGNKHGSTGYSSWGGQGSTGSHGSSGSHDPHSAAAHNTYISGLGHGSSGYHRSQRSGFKHLFPVHDLTSTSEHITTQCMNCMCTSFKDCLKPTSQCGLGFCGLFKITKPYWVDAGKLTLGNDEENTFENCSKDIKCVMRTVQEYMKRFRQDCNNDGHIDCLDYAMIHIFGGYGCKNNRFDESIQKQIQVCASRK